MLNLFRLAALGAALASAPVFAHATTITFDTYAAGTSITTQFSGLTVSGGTVYTPTGAATPTRSGQSELISGSGAPLTLNFSNGQSQISGYYTSLYGTTATIYANGSSTPFSTLIFGPSVAQTSFALNGTNLTRVTLTPNSGSITVDDLTYTAPVQTSPAPEPASLLLLGTGLLGASMLPAWRASRLRLRHI